MQVHPTCWEKWKHRIYAAFLNWKSYISHVPPGYPKGAPVENLTKERPQLHSTGANPDGEGVTGRTQVQKGPQLEKGDKHWSNICTRLLKCTLRAERVSSYGTDMCSSRAQFPASRHHRCSPGSSQVTLGNPGTRRSEQLSILKLLHWTASQVWWEFPVGSPGLLSTSEAPPK